MYIVCDCPDCGLPADVEAAGRLQSTHGEVEHAKVMCPRGHFFFMPAEDLQGVTVFFDHQQ
jgi:hypothetical protein